jgi:hypothetical protein
MFSVFRNTAVGLGAAVMLTGVAGLVIPANAAFIATMDQVGADVVITGSGSFDTIGLTPTSPFIPVSTAFVDPSINALVLGGGGTQNAFTGLTPDHATFGNGAETLASSTSGAVLGIAAAAAGFNSLYLPNGYVSGTSVSDLTTFAGDTFASLGVTPGTYVWTWGSGATADSFTLQIGPAQTVPEPASLTLLAVGLAGLGMVLHRRRA